MRVSVLIRELAEFLRTNGDMEVGINNPEFVVCEDIKSIAVRDKSAGHAAGSMSADDESLGERFIELSA